MPKRKKDPEMPKRHLSSYMFYSKERRPKIQEEQPDLQFGEYSKIIAAEWRDMSAENKERYFDLSKADKDRYEEEIKIYKEKKKNELPPVGELATGGGLNPEQESGIGMNMAMNMGMMGQVSIGQSDLESHKNFTTQDHINHHQQRQQQLRQQQNQMKSVSANQGQPAIQQGQNLPGYIQQRGYHPYHMSNIRGPMQGQMYGGYNDVSYIGGMGMIPPDMNNYYFQGQQPYQFGNQQQQYDQQYAMYARPNMRNGYDQQGYFVGPMGPQQQQMQNANNNNGQQGRADPLSGGNMKSEMYYQGQPAPGYGQFYPQNIPMHAQYPNAQFIQQQQQGQIMMMRQPDMNMGGALDPNGNFLSAEDSGAELNWDAWADVRKGEYGPVVVIDGDDKGNYGEYVEDDSAQEKAVVSMKSSGENRSLSFSSLKRVPGMNDQHAAGLAT